MLTTSLLVAASLVMGQADDGSPLPEEIAKMYECQMGTWKIEGSVGEDTATARWSCRWARGKHCYFITCSADSVDEEGVVHKMAAIGGYDSTKQQTIEKIFWSNDRHYTIRYDVSSPILEVGVYKGEIECVEKGKTYTAPVNVERKGPSVFVYRSETAEGDKIELVFRKVERARRKKRPGTEN